MKILAIDIETGPTEDERVNKLLFKKLSPPKNYKDPDKIEEYLKNKLLDEVMKTALNPLFGKIVSVAASSDGVKANAITLEDTGGDEKLLVTRFLNYISEWRANNKYGKIVGHNLFEFDLPFIYRRAVVLDIDMSKFTFKYPIPKPDDKPWRVEYVYDTMLAWGKPYPRLKELAMMFGLLTGEEDELDGGGALDAYLSGKMDLVKEHNMNDVIISYKVAERMMKAGM